MDSKIRRTQNAKLPSDYQRTTTALLIALVFIGICEPLGVILPSERLRLLGRLTSASNSPLVFNQVGGIEFWANKYALELIDHRGRVRHIDVTNDLVAKIRGPHTRTAAYVVPIGLSPILPPDVYLPPLRYGLCNGGPLARDLGINPTLKLATIEIASGSPDDQRRWSIEIPCSL